MLTRIRERLAQEVKAIPGRSETSLDYDVPAKKPVRFSILFALIPTVFILILTDVVVRYTDSGYSVIIIILLGVMLYTALRSGLLAGLLSALAIILYNFYLVAGVTDSAIFSLETLQRGGVIAVAFPILAIIVGRLRQRIDSLLLREQRARLEAEESAKQLRFMAETMPQKIFTTLPDGDTAYINPQWKEYINTDDQDGSENEWAKIVHPDDYEENEQLWKQSLTTGEPFQFEHRLRRHDGEYIWHLTRARALRDKNGKIELWIGSSTDIEDVRKTKKLEADTARLIRQRTQLMELNTAKDEFISLASHQLRTPATGVKQYINMAIDGFAGPVSNDVKKILRKADESNERQLSVINDLLQVAQVDAGKVVLRKVQVDVNELISSVVSEQTTKFKHRKQRVRVEETQKNLTVMADASKLRMVLENIIDNASKYSPEGATVTIRTMSSRGKVRIIIADEGVGIDKKDIAKVFHKFIRLDNPLSKIVGGSGLGLYWVQKIIGLHGGEVTVTSEISKGSTFTISLPT